MLNSNFLVSLLPSEAEEIEDRLVNMSTREQSNSAKTLNKHKRLTTNHLHDINVFNFIDQRNKTLRMSGVSNYARTP